MVYVVNSHYRNIQWSAKPYFNYHAILGVAKSNDVISIINKANCSCMLPNDYYNVEHNCNCMCISSWLHINHELPLWFCSILRFWRANQYCKGCKIFARPGDISKPRYILLSWWCLLVMYTNHRSTFLISCSNVPQYSKYKKVVYSWPIDMVVVISIAIFHY